MVICDNALINGEKSGPQRNPEDVADSALSSVQSFKISHKGTEITKMQNACQNDGKKSSVLLVSP